MNALEFGASVKWNFINTHRSLKDNKKRTSFWSQIISSWLTSHSRKTDILFFTFHSNECGCGNSIIIYVGPNPRQHLILSAGILTPPYGWGKEVSRIKEWLAVLQPWFKKVLVCAKSTSPFRSWRQPAQAFLLTSPWEGWRSRRQHMMKGEASLGHYRLLGAAGVGTG